ncbi:hypothetical protein ACFPN2_24125 [Steroidobacter flavus]|uniref:Sulfotransferase family protein n=1 Tax=Steroidobacter flavus TaxID=1842136 RepID=A0ABV8SX56_9GAMM
MSRPNVYLHGGWRCGSTYVWNRFRALRETLSYYEPFSEQLASCTTESILKNTEQTWDSRHPALSAPYFSEYLPLVGTSGVCFYDDRFATQRYFSAAHQKLFEEDYLGLLLEFARNENKRAVFGFSRSLGRVGAIKRVFDGCHVVLVRDPLQQWLSSRSYREQTQPSYFELQPLMILALARPESPAGAIARWLRLPKLSGDSYRHQYRSLRRHFRTLDDELSYRAFIAVYLLSYMHALLHADLVIDMDLLSRSPSYRQSISSAFEERVDLAPDFSDCSLPLHATDALPIDVDRIHDEVAERVLNQEIGYRGELASASIAGSFSVVMNKLRAAHRGPANAKEHSALQSIPLVRTSQSGSGGAGGLRRWLGLG